MQKIVRRLMLGALAAAVLVISVGDSLAEKGSGSGGSGGGSEIRYEGTITAINPLGPNVTLRVRNGGSVLISINDQTKLERNDRHVQFVTAFKIGDRGQARINSTTRATTKFEATGP